MSSFTAVSYDEYNIGKHIKTSKKRLSWIFHISSHHSIDLFISKLSNKFIIRIDGTDVIQAKRNKKVMVTYSVSVENCELKLKQIGSTAFELMIGTDKFSELLGRTERTVQFRPNQTNPVYEDWDPTLKENPNHSFDAPELDLSDIQIRNLSEEYKSKPIEYNLLDI